MERRQFLQWGAATIIGTAVLGACTDGGNGTGAPGQPAPTTATTTPGGTGPTDLTLVRTAASLEAVLIAAHEQLAKSPLLTSSTLRTLSDVFVLHHTQHLAALNGVITAAAGQPITDPNPTIDKTIVQPAFAAARTQDDLVHLVFTLEDATAQTYAYAAGAMTRPDLRSTAMTIGGIEAEHRVLVGLQLEQQPLDDEFPGPFARDENPLPPDAVLT